MQQSCHKQISSISQFQKEGDLLPTKKRCVRCVGGQKLPLCQAEVRVTGDTLFAKCKRVGEERNVAQRIITQVRHLLSVGSRPTLQHQVSRDSEQGLGEPRRFHNHRGFRAEKRESAVHCAAKGRRKDDPRNIDTQTTCWKRCRHKKVGDSG